MNCLVVGLGSIGTRHQRVLREMGHSVTAVSRRLGSGDVRSIAAGVASARPSYAVVATETGDHHRVLTELGEAGYGGIVLVEKPLGFVDEVVFEPFERVAVGYNLRFHSCLVALRDHLQDQSVISVQARVGQIIDEWRPGRDVRSTASNGSGGGALRDLSHELDLLDWLFGRCTDVAAVGGAVRSLDLDVDGVWSCLLRHVSCPQVSLEMNYLDSPPTRFMHVATANHSYVCDLVASRLAVDGVVVVDDSRGMDLSYQQMHSAILEEDSGAACSVEEGLRTMRVIHSIERAARERTWVRVH